MSIDEVEHQRKRTRQGQDDAKDAAIKLLAGRPHTQKELRSKLLEKGFSMEVIKNAIDRLQELVSPLAKAWLGRSAKVAGLAAGALKVGLSRLLLPCIDESSDPSKPH